MSEEERKIIQQLKALCDVWVKCGGNMISYNQDQVHCLYGYITKLQQENSQLKENNLSMQEEMCRCWEKVDKLQQRIEKAIEYIRLNFCNNEYLTDCWHSDIEYILETLKGKYKNVKD